VAQNCAQNQARPATPRRVFHLRRQLFPHANTIILGNRAAIAERRDPTIGAPMTDILVEVALYEDEAGEPIVCVLFSGFTDTQHAQRNMAAIQRSIASTTQGMRLN
jgi:hypothetical protein